jgi:hypothetical protein
MISHQVYCWVESRITRYLGDVPAMLYVFTTGADTELFFLTTGYGEPAPPGPIIDGIQRR